MEISLCFQVRVVQTVLLRAFFAIGLALLPAVGFAAPTNPSGLPLPRFVVTRAKDVTVRVGPGYQYDVAWKYLASGIPVEVVQEFDVWRKIRDVDGTEGWVHQTSLSGGRAGYVLSSVSGEIGLRANASDEAGVVAWVGPSFPVRIESCDGAWCDVSATDNPPGGRLATYTGYLPQTDLWGVYKGESFN
jgi:SH3-like domain-containing protein